ncbi:MAG: hypothetical protein ACOCVM_08295 [Desulfovibrionaceae bacterium]
MFRKMFVAALVAGSLALWAQPAAAGGPFRDVLFDNFCQTLPYHEQVGCNGYLQYRIQRGKSRDQAIENCLWGCGEVMNDPTKVPDCKKGCQHANGLDN